MVQRFVPIVPIAFADRQTKVKLEIQNLPSQHEKIDNII